MAWRTFIAIELDAPLIEALRAPIQGLDGIAAVRPSAAAGIHLTLNFLGTVDPGRVDELAQWIGPLVAGRPRFEVEVRGVGAFPSVRRPQVLYADLARSRAEPLIGLQAALRPALLAAGLPIEARPFKPHLTLGRARRPLKPDEVRAVEAWLRRWEPSVFGTQAVTEAVLMRSELGGGPPRYSALHRFPLEEELRPGGFEPPHPGP